MTAIYLPSPQTTLVVLLGASEYPETNGFDNRAFANSAEALRAYFLDTYGLPKENLLDLFDREESPSEQEKLIAGFIEKRVASLKKSESSARDIILYYIGHGDFNPSRRYHLFLRYSKEPGPPSTKLGMESLATTLKESARHLRRIVILDNCFAANAQHAFGAPQDKVALMQTITAFQEQDKGSGFPPWGTSLLCASNQNDPSVTPEGASLTAFTEALLYVLNNGDLYRPEESALSLHTIHRLMVEFLTMKYNDRVPRPEVHSPDQSKGIVADIPLFPNTAYKSSTNVSNTDNIRILLQDQISSDRQMQFSPKKTSLDKGKQFASIPPVVPTQLAKVPPSPSTATFAQLPNSPTYQAKYLPSTTHEEKQQEIQPQTQAQLKARIEDEDEQRRWVAAEALLTRRLHCMIHLQQETYIDTSLVACAEYQLFLDEKRSQGHYYQPDHWAAFSFPNGLENTPVLGVRRSDAEAFCEWLTTRDGEGWRYRLPHTGEWPIKMRKQREELGTETGYWTRPYFEWVQGKCPRDYKQQLVSIYDKPSDLVASAFRFASDDELRKRGFREGIKSDISRLLSYAVDRTNYTHDIDSIFHQAHALNRIHADIKAEVEAKHFSSSAVSDLAFLSTNANDIASKLAFDRKHASDSGKAIADAYDIALNLAGKLVITYWRTYKYEFGGCGPNGEYFPTQHQREVKKYINHPFDLYVGVCLLQKRIEGSFPACEGILLVKEPKRTV